MLLENSLDELKLPTITDILDSLENIYEQVRFGGDRTHSKATRKHRYAKTRKKAGELRPQRAMKEERVKALKLPNVVKQSKG